MNIIGITLIAIALIWIILLVSGNDAARKKKKRVIDYKASFKKEIDSLNKEKVNLKPVMEKSIAKQKNVIEKADKNYLIDWYKKTLIACHPSEFKSALNNLKKLHSVLKNHVHIEEHHSSKSPSETKPPNNPAAMYFDDAIEHYKKYGYEKLFRNHLYQIHKERLVAGDISYQHFSPLECITILYEKIYLEQHKKNLQVEETIKKELKEIIDDFESWRSKTIKNVTDFVEGATELNSDSLLYFKEDYPLSLNYNNSINGDPLAFPWHRSNRSLRDKFLGSGGEERNRIDGMRQDLRQDSSYDNNPYLEKWKAFSELEIERYENLSKKAKAKAKQEILDLEKKGK